MVFLKRFPFGQIDHFGLKMACCHNTGSTLRIYFEILKKYMKISLMFFFSEKKSFWANGSFWIQKWFDFITLNSLSDLFLFSKIKGTKRYMKLNGFSKKIPGWGAGKCCIRRILDLLLKIFLYFCKMKEVKR